MLITSPSSHRLRLWLGTAGLIPFCALSLWMQFSDSPHLLTVFSAYSCAILSFLAGTLWGQVITASNPCKLSLLLLSNLFSLLAWAALVLVMFGYSHLGILLYMFAYLGLFAFEHKLIFQNYTTDQLIKLRNYWQLRAVLTGLVVLFHALALIGSL